jgi:hypothetical protein
MTDQKKNDSPPLDKWTEDVIGKEPSVGQTLADLELEVDVQQRRCQDAIRNRDARMIWLAKHYAATCARNLLTQNRSPEPPAIPESDKPYSYDEARHKLQDAIDDMRMLYQSPDRLDWKDIANTAAINFYVLAIRLRAAATGNYVKRRPDSKLRFPSPYDED